MVQLYSLHVDIQLSQHHLLNRLFFPSLNGLSILVENELKMYRFISRLSIQFHLSKGRQSLPQYHYFDYCSFVVNFEIKKYESSYLFFFFKIVSASWNSLKFHMNFRISFSTSENRICGIWSFYFLGISLYLYIALGSTIILTTLWLQPTSIDVHLFRLPFISFSNVL